MKNVLFLFHFIIVSTAISQISEAQDISTDEVRAIAKEACVYGFPMVDNLRIQYAYFTDKQSPEFKAPYSHIFNIPRVDTPADTAVQTPDSDRPYSWLGFDLRTGPIVIYNFW